MAAAPSDPAYAARCLDHARRLFAFAAKVGAGCEGWWGWGPGERWSAGRRLGGRCTVPGRLPPYPADTQALLDYFTPLPR